MVTKEKVHNFKITLPLIALCIPLFARYSLKAENGCPYETYVRVHGRCLDISQEGLRDITVELNSDSIAKVDREVKQVGEELAELSEELTEFDNKAIAKVDREIKQVNQELAELSEELEALSKKSVPQVDLEIKQVGQELAELSEELEEFCTEEKPETETQVEIMEDVCQY